MSLFQLLLFVIGLVLLVVGAEVMVKGASRLAVGFRIPPLVIGLTVVAFGTSAPEMAVSAGAALSGQGDIALGNVLGSNLFNLLAVLGLASLLAPQGITVSAQVLRFDMLIMLAVAIACLPIFFSGLRINRWEGLLFLGYYLIYTLHLILAGSDAHLGKGKKDAHHLDDMDRVFASRTKKYGYVDYVGCWFVLAADYCRRSDAVAALVATNSVCQGRQLPQLWQQVLLDDVEIVFAHHSFKWANSAARNAGVICVIVGIAPRTKKLNKTIYGSDFSRSAQNINAYLIDGDNIFVESRPRPAVDFLPHMSTGSVPNDGGNLILNVSDALELKAHHPEVSELIHPFYGSEDFLKGNTRSCLVIDDDQVKNARKIEPIRRRLDAVEVLRSKSPKKETREQLSKFPHRFQHRGAIPNQSAIIIPSVSSERREWFPAGMLDAGTVISNLAFLISDAPIWNMALIASRLHLVWLATVCGKLKTDFRYSNTLGWNTFPVPFLTEQNKADLTTCAENILLAREAHFPATIADLYDPEKMPDNLRAAHEHNDEVLERIYIGRRFRNDTERLEKLFDLYTKMTAAEQAKPTTRPVTKGTRRSKA